MPEREGNPRFFLVPTQSMGTRSPGSTVHVKIGRFWKWVRPHLWNEQCDGEHIFQLFKMVPTSDRGRYFHAKDINVDKIKVYPRRLRIGNTLPRCIHPIRLLRGPTCTPSSGVVFEYHGL